MKPTKSLMEMTAQELREEIGRLGTLLDKVTQKNKRRRTALKQLNTHALVTFKMMSDLLTENRRLAMVNRNLQHSVELSRIANFKTEQTPFGAKVTFEENGPKTEVQQTKRWFHHILPRGAKGVSGA